MRKRETRRLLLRELNSNDVSDIYEYASLLDIVSRVGMKHHTSIDVTKKYINHELSKDETFGIELKSTKKLIGTISLRKIEEQDSLNVRLISIIIHPNYWGKGYGTEAIKEVIRMAFVEEHVQIIKGGCYSFNNQSKRVQEKLGFVFNGVKKEVYEYKGKTYDALEYSLSYEEYKRVSSKW